MSDRTSGALQGLSRRGLLGSLFAAAVGALWLGRARKAESATEELPFIGEIRMFAGSFAPFGWMFCEGQLLPIAEYDALFTLLGTTYGGDGQDTFALPDLRGRAPIHAGDGPSTSARILGESGGQESVTLLATQLPIHTHLAGAASGLGVSDDPTGRVPARNVAGVPAYHPTHDTSLSPGALLAAGSNAPHDNMQPYVGIHYIISLFGNYPTP